MTIEEIKHDYFTYVVPHIQGVTRPGMRCAPNCPCEYDSAIVASILAEFLKINPGCATDEQWDEAYGIAVTAGLIDEDE
jgi:hypothetical protein